MGFADRSAAIQAKGLSKTFGKLRAVDRLDLSVRHGELFSLLGPNGAGKTTTIKMLCCLLKPDGGSATIMGLDTLRDALAVKQIIDISPQETALAGNLNAWENLSLIGRSHGLDKATVRQRSEELLNLMGLQDRSKERVKRFSGGMQRRLSIAMALVSDPQVLFLDEPTLGLDPQSRARLWEQIRDLKGEKTLMLTTHYLEEADSLADRIAIVDHGKIVAQGTSQELKASLSGAAVMHIEAEGLTDEVIKEIRAVYPTVRRVEGGIEIEAEEIDLYAIQDILRPRGIAIRSSSLKRATLDDVFLQITGRELRE